MNRIISPVISSCLIISFIIFSVNVFAQTTHTDSRTNYNLKQALPTSPEAALLGRFGDIPIGYYTGTADISIPLYTIKEDGIEIPITLSYHSSGIKVADQATNVGLGWLLEPGGAIIQIVNGMADQSDNFASELPSDYNFLMSHVDLSTVHASREQIGVGSETCTADPNDGDTWNSMQGLLSGELQPDIYQYNFPGGYSGKFYINPSTKKIVMIDKQQQIFFQQNVNGGTNWMATTLDGDKYYFNDEETSTDGTYGRQGLTFKLTQIILHNGKTINFGYTNTSYSWNSGYSETYHTEYPSDVIGLMSAAEFQIQSQSSNINYYNKTISQIKTANVIINFNQGTRTDMQTPSIQSVDIISAVTGNKIKTFTFTYGYFAYSQIGQLNGANDGSDNLEGQRLKLLSVQETGYDPSGNATSNPPYQFAYNESSPLPMKNSFAQDFWGYYNGVNNTNLLTDLTYPYYAGMLGAGFPYPTVTTIHGANRAVDTSKVSIGMLNQITYPTGGYTQFGYESNSFSNYDYPDVNKLSSRYTNLYVEDENSPTDHTSAQIVVNRSQIFSINGLFSKGYPSNNVPYSTMAQGYIAVTKTEGGATTTVKEWQITSNQQNSTYTSTGNVSIQDTCYLLADPNATYQLVVSLPDNLGNQSGSSTLGANVSASCSYYNVPNLTSNLLSYGGGVRVASVRNYDSNGSLLNNRSMKYINTDGSCSGLLMSPLLLTYYRTISFTYQQDAQQQQIPTATGNVWYLSSESFVPYSTAAGGNLVGYSRVQETDLSNGVASNGSHVYAYNNEPSETGVGTPDNPNLLNGKISTDQMYTSTGKLLSQTTYKYTSLSDTVYEGFKNQFNLIYTYWGDGCGPELAIPFNFMIWTIYNYPIISHWYVLANKSTTSYDGAAPVSSINYYSYNNIGQLIKDSTINSKSESLVQTYIYPYDKTTRSAIEQDLVDSAFYNTLLEQHSYRNGYEMSKAVVSYNLLGYGGNNYQLVRSNIQRSFGGQPLYTDFTFDQYGANKTLQQASEKSLRPSAMVWDDTNSYLIAETNNAHVGDIAYTSFEFSQSGNWTIPSATRNSFGFTGNQSYALTNGALTKGGLNSATTYMVTYWSQNGAFNVNGSAYTQGPTINGWTYYVHQLSGQTGITISGTGNIDEVRLYPSNALMTSYTYQPLIGLTSMSDAKGMATYYEYDPFQRLVNIKDKDGNIVKHIDYHYQGQ